MGWDLLYVFQPAVDQALTGFSEAFLWPSVVCELQNGVKLRKPTERPQHRLPPAERIRSPYELLLDDIQCKRFTLRKVSDQSQWTTLKPPVLPHF